MGTLLDYTINLGGEKNDGLYGSRSSGDDAAGIEQIILLSVEKYNVYNNSLGLRKKERAQIIERNRKKENRGTTNESSRWWDIMEVSFDCL